MRGHEDLIRLRKAGQKPAGLVYIDDYPVTADCAQWVKHDAAPSICTHGDDLGTLDLRFVVGLKVSVQGDDAGRVGKLSAMCRRMEAEMVLAQCGDRLAVWNSGDTTWRTS